ncbi:hypothetical protein [Flavobacterium sp. XGLA_31]|uniref:hypothetical protein n=1 Tax=Flavobacterium sp. XGLA_31 TaxID=3447666 RepID=UPI003F31B983
MIGLILNVKRNYCFFLWALVSVSTIAQKNIENLKFQQNTIYVFCRGTKTKAGFIAGKFNTKDRLITHVGIGFVENDQLKIYNVIDCDTTKTALVIDDLKSFVCDKAYYLSVWKCKNNSREFLKLREACQKYGSRKIFFDYAFNLNGKDDLLYCSEFCSRVLRIANSEKFNFHPKKMKLESFYKAVLRRDELLYYPVDFFQESQNFTKIFETNFKTEKS